MEHWQAIRILLKAAERQWLEPDASRAYDVLKKALAAREATTTDHGEQ